MFQRSRTLAIDVGASRVVLAEFGTTKAGTLELRRYAIGPLGVDPESEADTTPYIVSTIRELLRDNDIKPAPVMMTISGQSVFPRYVKLPHVTKDKVQQIIRYEAEQNVPFPMEEVVWDYQLIDGEAGEINVLLIAVKADIVKHFADCVVAAGLEPAIVDVAPMALSNAVRYNYPDAEGCTMVLDIGARSSNLIFLEGNRVFTRSIPVAGNAMTQELMREFNLPFKDAEELKLAHALVGFGGVYAGPDGEVADKVSRLIRGVVTRLHAEVNRSINFYRGQQGGSNPSLVLLTGGSSVIPHLDTFFRDKLNTEVDYLNPFRNIPVGERIDAEKIGTDIHLLGAVAGAALRSVLSCPVEIDLMPPDLLAKKTFRKRQPFFALAAAAFLLTMFCWGIYFFGMRRMTHERQQTIEDELRKRSGDDSGLANAERESEAARKNLQSLVGVVRERARWIEVLGDIHSMVPDGMWLTAIRPVSGSESGICTNLEVRGMAFEDKFRDAQGKSKVDEAIDEFRDALRNGRHFGKDVQIGLSRPKPGTDYVREFSITVPLKAERRD